MVKSDWEQFKKVKKEIEEIEGFYQKARDAIYDFNEHT